MLLYADKAEVYTMRKKITKTCLTCNTKYQRVGVLGRDWGYCSKACFRVAGPMPTTNTNNVLPRVYPSVVPCKPKKSKRNKNKRSSGRFYKTQEWKELRFRVLAKYGRLCMCCGTTTGSMHVDHIKPRSRRPDLSLNFNNLQVLCSACNLGKSNLSDEDFRPKPKNMVYVKVNAQLVGVPIKLMNHIAFPQKRFVLRKKAA